MLLIHNAVTSDHFIECKTCGMKFWVGDGHFDRGKAEAAHKTYAASHPIKPVWLRKSIFP